jgi:hypothetical protein
MDQPPLDNKTEFAVHPQLLLDRDGEKLVAMVKASFELVDPHKPLDLAPPERMRGIRMADIPWGEPDISSIAYPADVCVRKPGTDVIVVGRGYAPGGKPVTSFDVRVEVGRLSKSLKIFGNRVWLMGGSGLSAPAPIAEIDLRYDYAWGGSDDSEPDDIVDEPRNPVGMGKVRDSAALTDRPAPNIEDPAALISSHRSAPPPAGVGPTGRHWQPRRQYVGTYDDAWTESRAPLPPLDFDDRHNFCASPGLYSGTPFAGGEKVRLLNVLLGGGALQFTLPKIQVDIQFRVDGREPVSMRPFLDTVLIDVLLTGPHKPPAVELVWRAEVKAPRRMNDSVIIVTERDIA